MTKEELAKKEADKKAAMDNLVADVSERVKESITPAVTEEVAVQVLEKLKNDKVSRKALFGGEGSENNKDLEEKKQITTEFLKALGDKKSTKALTTTGSTTGAELVPTYISDQFITVAQDYGLTRKYANKFPMNDRILENIPTIGAIQAYRSLADGSAINSQQPATGAVSLHALTAAVIIPVTKVLLQQATFDLGTVFAYLAGKAFAKMEDQWALPGVNSGEGVFLNSSVPVATLSSGKITYASVTATDLLSAENLLDENFVASDSNKLRWIMSRSVLNTLRAERSVINGSPNQPQGFLLPGYGQDTPPMLWDHPYDTSAVMPKTSDGSQTSQPFLGLVDWDNIILGDCKEYVLEVSDQATITDTDGSTLINLYQQNMVALKFWGLIDIKLSNASKAFGVLKTAAS